MNTKLVSISAPVIPGITTAEDLIAYCARVSNPSNQLNTETAPKLLAYLIKKRHWSPFEMVSVTLEITTSRAIAAQILRHRSFSFQEFSQRYSQATALCDVELRQQATTNRQSSSEVIDPGLKPRSGFGPLYPASKRIAQLNEQSLELYNQLIEAGVAKESARMILPLCTQTTMYMAGTLRSWVHYLDLRCEEGTQLEHRRIAKEARSIIATNFPTVAAALEWPTEEVAVTTETVARADFPQCSMSIRKAGLAYPRTCRECGLGPCRHDQG